MSAVIKHRDVEGIAILDIAGKITLGEGSSAVRDAIRDINVSGQNKILLNLSEVSYIDSAGMGELISAYTSTTNRGGTIKLLGLTKRVKDLLQITKLYTVFDIHEEESHAIRSFRIAAAHSSGA